MIVAHPYHNYILVAMNQPDEEVRDSGITIVAQADRQVVGVVLAKGPDVKESLEIGQEVLVPPYGAGLILDKVHRMYLDYEVIGGFRP